ncbi:RNA polymerase sigma factor (sigma-70 family) [Pedobacter sp. UYP24]
MVSSADKNKADFVLLIDQQNGIIHKICRLYRDRTEDRQDLFQEITYQLWKAYPSFKGASKISTWLYRIALNTAISSFRKKNLDISYPSELPDVADDQVDDEQITRHEKLFKALQKLNDADKAIITLYLEDLSYQQIAEISGINENYVGVKINRIKTKIQSYIK